MTAMEFNAICGDAGVHPDIAIENQKVRDLLVKDFGRSLPENALMLSGLLQTEF